MNPASPSLEIPDGGYEFSDEDFHWFRRRASEHSGIVLPESKRSMIYSRLVRRLRALGLPNFHSYRQMLSRDNSPEFGEFINAITTNLTAFFREPHHFAHLRDVALPTLRAERAAGVTLRFWSAGCSTGEEPYSLAMTLEAEAAKNSFPFEILATDLDTRVLQHSSQGVYPLDRLEPIPAPYRKNYLWRGAGEFEGKFRVREDVRARIHFAQLNLITDWRLPHLCHVIFCRNVVIYFDKDVQRRLFDRFANQLAPGGFLYIGHAESLFQISDRFEPCGQTVYRKLPE